MGRKRSIAGAVNQREARRKKIQAVERLYEWGYCPRCRRKTIETDYVQTRRSSGVIVSERTQIPGPHGDIVVTCKMAASICRSCQSKMQVWLLPNESLIELYHMHHDKIHEEIMYIELFEWLYSDIKESREDKKKRLAVDEEKKLQAWRDSAETIIVVPDKVKAEKEVMAIPEPRLTE